MIGHLTERLIIRHLHSMQPNDRKAIAELTELARILSGMEQIRKDKKEANLKIEFVTRKMQEQEEEK